MVLNFAVEISNIWSLTGKKCCPVSDIWINDHKVKTSDTSVDSLDAFNLELRIEILLHSIKLSFCTWFSFRGIR